MTDQEKATKIEQTVRQFAADYLEKLRWQIGQMIPGADNVGLDIWHDNILERTMQPQDWLQMARYGAGLEEADPGYIAEICQSMAEWLFAIPGEAAYSIPDQWADSDMGALWWAAYTRSQGDELITLAEAARLSGTSIKALSNRLDRGQLQAFIDPTSAERQGRRLVRKSDVMVDHE